MLIVACFVNSTILIDLLSLRMMINDFFSPLMRLIVYEDFEILFNEITLACTFLYLLDDVYSI